MTLIKKLFINNLNTTFLINPVIKSLSNENYNNIKIGNIIQICYKNIENNKEILQKFEGIIISIKNKQLLTTFTIRSLILGINLEQIFYKYSPNIISIIKKNSFKVKRAKLYFLRFLKIKSIKLKKKN